MSTAWLTVIAAVSTALVGAGVVLTRAVMRWSQELAALRAEIADLRIEIVGQRSADRLEVRDLIDSKLREHVASCPQRGHTNPGRSL